MLCSNCGKDIPFAGKVCPFCKADKSGDQHNHTYVMLFYFIGWFIGYYFVGFFKGILVAFLFAIIGWIIGENTKKKENKSQIIQ